jgi:hypothetical protein
VLLLQIQIHTYCLEMLDGAEKVDQRPPEPIDRPSHHHIETPPSSVIEGRHRDGVARACLQFDTCTEYRRRQADYGGGWGVMHPGFRLSGRASGAHKALGGISLLCRRNWQNMLEILAKLRCTANEAG